MESNSKADKLTKTLLIIYLLALVWILIFKLGVRFSYMGSRSVNLIPFDQPLRSNGGADLSEIILNVVIFVPLGIYSGVLFRTWAWRKKLFFVLSVSLLIEVVQYTMKIGAFDITDIITNVTGGLMGLLIFIAVDKLFNNSFKSQRFINIVAAVGTLVMVSLLVMLKLNMLPVKYQ
jgi:glycopeptide antibiotics resistance protein